MVVVDDLAAMRAYYVDLLGCHVALQGTGFALFRFAWHFLILVTEPGAPFTIDAAALTRGLTLTLPVPDVQDAHRVLARRVPGLGPVVETPLGRHVALTDPSGVRLWLLEPAAP
jgi:catechol 2,3-dioxygenase-like lactoylglutathione lyase family enzyme